VYFLPWFFFIKIVLKGISNQDYTLMIKKVALLAV